MPNRAILLKLVVPRSAEPDAAVVREAFWRTHAEVNAATAYYERKLLLLRGAHYRTVDGETGDEAARGALLAYARETQAANMTRLGAPLAPHAVLPGGDEEVAAVLANLYAAIVPTSGGQDGNAQAANGYLSPLADPSSAGFTKAAEKINRPVPNS